MATEIIKILLQVALGGFAVSFVVTRWQTRNWLRQQRFLAGEKDVSALQELTDELTTLGSARVYLAKRVRLLLPGRNKEKLRLAEEDYRDAVKKWNERFGSFSARLPILTSPPYVAVLDGVQNSMVKASLLVESGLNNSTTRKPLTPPELAQMDKALQRAQVVLLQFTQSLVREVKNRRREIYVGQEIRFGPHSLERFSTWELIKALFVRDINAYTVLRTPGDP